MFNRTAAFLTTVLAIGSYVTLQANPEPPQKEQSSQQETANGSEPKGGQNALEEQQIEQSPNPDAASEKALLLLIAYLRDASAVCQEQCHYTACLEKHVSIDGKLQDLEMIDAKVRHNPFSVYLKWQSNGQQALYVKGQNDDRVIAKPNNALSLLRSVWKLDPKSKQAMKGCRYPITEFGISRLCERVTEVYLDRSTRAGMTCTFTEKVLDERPVMVFDVTFHSPAECRDYSHSKIYFDSVGKWIVGVENDGWTADGRPGDLIEKYIYHDINFDAPLKDLDFSLENPTYEFAKN